MICLLQYPAQKRAAGELHSRLSRALLEFSLSNVGLRPDMLEIAGGTREKPFIEGLPGLYISISHCDGLSACALGGSELGIDAENIRPFDERVAHRICAGGELGLLRRAKDPDAAFFRLWTLKESYGKALGVGLGYPMREASFSIDGGRVHSNITGYDFTLFEGIGGYIVALCRRKPFKKLQPRPTAGT